MKRYTFLKKGLFQNMDKFETELNNMVKQGWNVHSFAQDSGECTVLLEREK